MHKAADEPIQPHKETNRHGNLTRTQGDQHRHCDPDRYRGQALLEPCTGHRPGPRDPTRSPHDGSRTDRFAERSEFHDHKHLITAKRVGIRLAKLRKIGTIGLELESNRGIRYTPDVDELNAIR